MTDYEPIDPRSGATPVRGPRTGVFLAIIALAFVAGAVLTGYLMQRVSWLGGTSADQRPAKAAQPDPANFNPAQPLNANGQTTNAALEPAAGQHPAYEPGGGHDAMLPREEAALVADTAALNLVPGEILRMEERGELLPAHALRRLGLGQPEDPGHRRIPAHASQMRHVLPHADAQRGHAERRERGPGQH